MKDNIMIHPTAIIDSKAILGADVSVGPWTTIGPNVDIGAGCIIHSHVVLKGPTVMGINNEIFQFSSVGEDTPDLKYKGESTRLKIGDNNVIREGVTIHRGTVQDRGLTSIGNNNLIMAYAHIGHDSMVGNNTIIVNNTALAGHVDVDDYAILSGFTLVHQFCHIGAHAFTGMGSAIGKDIPAYVRVSGNPAAPHGINSEGLKRRGFSAAAVGNIRKAYKVLYRQGNTIDIALSQLEALAIETPEIQLLIDSVNASRRGIVR